MPKTVYLITGPSGVGKSTVSLALAKLIKNSAHINADFLYNMVIGGHVKPWIDTGKYMDLLWSNVLCLMENFLSSDIEVIIDYIIYPERLESVLKVAEKYHFEVCYIVLLADKGTLITRDRQRDADEIVGNRVVELLAEFKSKGIDERFIVNTTTSLADEIAEFINLHSDKFIIY